MVAKRVYKGLPISFPNNVRLVDLIKLYMLHFDVILEMYLLNAFFDFIDCSTRVVKFQFSNEPLFEWKEVNSNPRGKIFRV